MDSRILYGIIALLVISTGTVFGQQTGQPVQVQPEPLIVIQTDDSHYHEGDTMVVSGSVKTVIGKTPIIIRIVYSETLIDVGQVKVAQDGSYTKTFLTEGLWNKSGEYTIVASYQDKKVDTSITFTAAQDAMEIVDLFKGIDAGSSGTFDVGYTIKGATITDMRIEQDRLSLIVDINSTDEGTITLNLPREYIGAENQDGKDILYIPLIDDIQVPYKETVSPIAHRVIMLDFEKGDSTIEIIGTYIIPEFGTVVMVIMIVGITMTILVTRNRMQINI